MGFDRNEVSFQEIKRVGRLSNEGVFIFDIAEENFSFANAALVRILEIDKNLLMEEPGIILHSVPAEDQEYLRLRFAELLDYGSVENVQVRLKQNNAEKTLSGSAYLTSDKGSVIGFLKDISTARNHEEYLVNYGARKDALLDMVAQNLSTPLNLSKFTVDLIDKAVKEKKYHKLNAHIRLMREVTSESIRVIDKFLQEEHLDSPNIHPKMSRFDVIAKILVVLEKLRETHGDKNFQLSTPVKHLYVETDDVKFFQIIHNLLSNAIKFTRPNGVIQVTVRNVRGKVQVEVKDDGIGIPEHLHPHIFEKHTRASRPGLNGEISNGIGLYVIKQLTDLLGGKITFKTNENEGSVFTLELPVGGVPHGRPSK